MRLIDADALIDTLNNSGIKFNAEINKIILEQPTADVEKLVSGAYKEGWSNAVDWYGIKSELVKRGNK